MESEIYKITVIQRLVKVAIYLFRNFFFLPVFEMETPGVWDVDVGC